MMTMTITRMMVIMTMVYPFSIIIFQNDEGHLFIPTDFMAFRSCHWHGTKLEKDLIMLHFPNSERVGTVGPENSFYLSKSIEMQR